MGQRAAPVSHEYQASGRRRKSRYDLRPARTDHPNELLLEESLGAAPLRIGELSKRDQRARPRETRRRRMSVVGDHAGQRSFDMRDERMADFGVELRVTRDIDD